MLRYSVTQKVYIMASSSGYASTTATQMKKSMEGYDSHQTFEDM